MNTYALGIMEDANKVLFLLRKHANIGYGHYGLPGGKVEDNESIIDGLIRELYEELAVNITRDDARLAHCLSFKNQNNNDELLVLIFKIHQWQREPINHEPEKHAELAWFAHSALPENVLPLHKHILQAIDNNILYSELGW